MVSFDSIDSKYPFGNFLSSMVSFDLLNFEYFFGTLFVSKILIDSYHSIIEYKYHFPATFEYQSIVMMTNQLNHYMMVSFSGHVTASALAFFHDPYQASFLLTSFMINVFILVSCSKVISSRFATILVPQPYAPDTIRFLMAFF